MKKKKRHIRDLKAKIVAAKQVLNNMLTQYTEALAVWDRMSQEYQQLGPTIMDPPSPLPSEWGDEYDGSEYEDSVISDNADLHTYPAQTLTSEENREQWQPVKKRKGRPNGQGNAQEPTDVQMQVIQHPPAEEAEEDID